ncbi:outer membrane beta-barrel family protein [Labilibacter marinus]|uniref:outer membrane beta-barrel family protein n=1 Tax=Labilibacter marinus TaxID=1477105 RepID=UPI000835A63F|nr:outer membrane beta-barrel family protein [Labilibacter marinus]
MKLIYFILLIALLIVPKTLLAQSNSILVKGVVVESEYNTPVEFATVIIKDKQTKKNITGTTTGTDGSFEIETNAANLYIEVSFIGFASTIIREFNTINGSIDLGTIQLSKDNQTVDEVTVRAEKSRTEFKLDKRVFNVGKDISSTGMSALEVLTNVPSVNVNIEGDISLRGSTGVQILINGKPSVIASEGSNALGTITAEMIDKIEVITNPSAKYDAEGTSGIINIVIKKEERKGLNGSMSVNAGVPNNHSVGISLNRRTEKFNLFSQFGFGHRELPRDKKSINTDNNTNTTVFSEGTEYRNETFYNVILGTDYHINKYNILTLSGNYAYEVEKQPSLIEYQIVEKDVETALWYRDEDTDATNPKWRYELQYKKDFRDKKDHQLLFSALGNFFGKDQSSYFKNTIEYGDVDNGDQQTRTDFKEAKHTFNLDYTNPFSKEFTLEAGSQFVLQDVSNDYEVLDLDGDEWVPDPGQTNVFEYDQKVLGVYSTAAYEGAKWGVKLGLRLEHTNLNTLLINTNERNQQNYSNLFPTLHSSLKLSSAFSLQAGYSRRIYRPRLWDLNPFFNIRNTYNVRVGNPDLKPEFTDSYEITSIYVFNKASLNLGVYYRYTTDAVERVSVFQDNIIVTKPMNIGTNRATGVEINGKYSPQKWLTFTGDFNYNYFKKEGEFNETIVDFNADQWSSRIVSKIKLPAEFEVELTGIFRSDRRTTQFEYAAQSYANFGLRKKLFKGKTVVNLSVRDVFESRISEGKASEPEYYLYNQTQSGRFITFGVSYGFGDGEAMEYSGRRR